MPMETHHYCTVEEVSDKLDADALNEKLIERNAVIGNNMRRFIDMNIREIPEHFFDQLKKYLDEFNVEYGIREVTTDKGTVVEGIASGNRFYDFKYGTNTVAHSTDSMTLLMNTSLLRNPNEIRLMSFILLCIPSM